MLFTGLGRSVFGETVPTASGGNQDLGHNFSQYRPPSRWITYIYFHMWRYQAFARKLTWYFIGVYIIKKFILDVLREISLKMFYYQTGSWVRINLVMIVLSLIVHKWSRYLHQYTLRDAAWLLNRKGSPLWKKKTFKITRLPKSWIWNLLKNAKTVYMQRVLYLLCSRMEYRYRLRITEWSLIIKAHYQLGCMYTALNVYTARSSIGGAHAVEVFL